MVGDRGEAGNQLADAGAVDVGYVAEIQEDLLVALADQASDRLPKRAGAFSQSDAPTTSTTLTSPTWRLVTCMLTA